LNRKIVVLSPFDPLNVGGVERVVREFSIRLVKHYDVEVIGGGRERKYYEYRGVPVNVLPSWTASYSYMPEARRLVRQLQPDLLYSHGFTQYAGYVSALAKKDNPRTKLIFHSHFHPSGSTLVFSLMRKMYDPLIGSMILNKADAVVTNSNSEAEAVRKSFHPLTPIHVVTNGVDIAALTEAKAKEIGENSHVLLFVGRMEPYKHPEILLELMRYVPEDFILVYAGTGSLMGALSARARRLGLNERVKFLGHISDWELYQWYKTASCLVHLSESESFGMTCIEALAAGTPCVANYDGFGLTETISLFPGQILGCDIKSTSLSDLAELVVRATSLKPVKVDLTNYSWDQLTSKLEAVFASVL